MRLWLDDVRDPVLHGAIGFHWVKTAEEAISCLRSGQVRFASLDHDLFCGSERPVSATPLSGSYSFGGGPVYRGSSAEYRGSEPTRGASMTETSCSVSAGDSKGLSVGAGEYTTQQLGTAQGLYQPRLAQVLTVRYLPADEVLRRLPAQHPTGFAQRPQADLGSVPRFGSSAPTVSPLYL